MYLAHRLVILMVGLTFLVPLYICIALPASPLPLVVRHIESPPIEPSLRSTWYTNATPPYGSGTDGNHLDKRGKTKTKTKEKPDKEERTLRFSAEEDRGGTHRHWVVKMKGENGVIDIVGVITQTGGEIGSGNFGTVYNGTWARQGHEPVPVAIKLSNGNWGYSGAKALTFLESPYVIGVYQYALIGDFKTSRDLQSITAYEKLGESAENAWLTETLLDTGEFYKAVMLGALAGVQKEIVHMDINPDNILRAGASWKLIDWDSFPYYPADAEFFYAQGTALFMAPEVYYHQLLVYQKESPAKVEQVIKDLLQRPSKRVYTTPPAQVFTIAIMFLYMQDSVHDREFTPEMEAFRKFLNTFSTPGKHEKHYEWLWIALHVAHLKGEATPEKVLKILPKAYQEEGERSEWGVWFSKTLCNTEERYTLQQAWEAFNRGGLERICLPFTSPLST